MRGTEHACIPAKIDEFMCSDFFVDSSIIFWLIVRCFSV